MTTPIRKQTEYMYCSARIRCMETRLFSADALVRLSDARGDEEVRQFLAEAGIARGEENDTEDALMGALAESYRTVAKTLPDPALTRFLQYPYDGHNIKSVIKCRARNLAPGRMLFTAGTVTPEATEMFVASLYAADKETKASEALFSPHVNGAAKEAALTFARTRAPGTVDRILDGAVYKDMAEDVKTNGVALAEALVADRADLCNAISFCRILRRKGNRTPAAGMALFDGVFLAGGKLCAEAFDALFALDEGEREKELLKKLKNAGYEAFVSAVEKGDGSLAVMEKAADNDQIRLIKPIKMVPFGPEVPLAYLVAREMETKNLRILLSGRAAGLDGGTVRERMRDTYV